MSGTAGTATTKPQLGDLAVELDELTWSEVVKMAIQLGMDFAILQKIAEDKSDSIRLLASMDTWLKTDPKASWLKVVKALRAIKSNVLAASIERKYCSHATVLSCLSSTTIAADGGLTTDPSPRAGQYYIVALLKSSILLEATLLKVTVCFYWLNWILFHPSVVLELETKLAETKEQLRKKVKGINIVVMFHQSFSMLVGRTTTKNWDRTPDYHTKTGVWAWK